MSSCNREMSEELCDLHDRLHIHREMLRGLKETRVQRLLERQRERDTIAPKTNVEIQAALKALKRKSGGNESKCMERIYTSLFMEVPEDFPDYNPSKQLDVIYPKLLHDFEFMYLADIVGYEIIHQLVLVQILFLLERNCHDFDLSANNKNCEWGRPHVPSKMWTALGSFLTTEIRGVLTLERCIQSIYWKNHSNDQKEVKMPSHVIEHLRKHLENLEYPYSCFCFHSLGRYTVELASGIVSYESGVNTYKHNRKFTIGNYEHTSVFHYLKESLRTIPSLYDFTRPLSFINRVETGFIEQAIKREPTSTVIKQDEPEEKKIKLE